MVAFAIIIGILLIISTASMPEKVLTAIFGLAMVGGMWWHVRRLRKRPSAIRVTDEGLIGESRTGEITRLSWQEINKIDVPPKWDIALDGMPRIILRSNKGAKEFVIGKNIRDYKELAEIIRANTPHCSHKYL
jgi:hypothetical protein